MPQTVAARMESLGVSVADLVDRSRVPRATVYRLLQGRTIGSDHVDAILKALALRIAPEPLPINWEQWQGLDREIERRRLSTLHAAKLEPLIAKHLKRPDIFSRMVAEGEANLEFDRMIKAMIAEQEKRPRQD